MHTITIGSRKKEEMIEITNQINDIVRHNAASKGICFIYTPHTTAAITINENADPDVAVDILKGLKGLQLENASFNHSEGNSPSHIKSSLIGCSAFVIIDNHELQLGTWQGIYLCEFDGPRSRKVFIEIIN